MWNAVIRRWSRKRWICLYCRRINGRYLCGKSEELIKSEFKAPKTRLVFWRETREGRNWYKFAGVFRLNRVQTENDQFYGDSWCWYDRVDTVAECPKADWRVSSIDEDAMDTMRGEFVKCELLVCKSNPTVVIIFHHDMPIYPMPATMAKVNRTG